jgi:hypothetical protein
VRSPQSDHAALRRHAGECGAMISDLDDSELLIRFMAVQEHAAVALL